jgi:hypothetical protein
MFPLIGYLVLYNVSILINGNNLRQFCSTVKGILSIVCLLFFVAGTCIPVNEFTTYLSKSPHPFRQYQWLSTSFIGTLFALSFLNYALLRPQGLQLRIVRWGTEFWKIPLNYFLLISAVWMFCIANLFSYAVFEHIPHVQDSIAQLFQAKIFARGSLTAPLPPIVDFFSYYYDNMVFTSRWYSQYPPGHSFFLMMGVLCNTPWIINPLFASLSSILLYKCALFYGDENEAKLTLILFCLSPFVLFMSSSYMNHVSTLFFLLLFLYNLNKAMQEKSSTRALLAGFSLGVMLNIRPPDAIAVGIVLGGFFFVWGMRERIYRPLVCFTLAIFLMISILLFYNYATNGNPLVFGYQVRWGKEHTLGFTNSTVMSAPPHTLLRGAIHTVSNLIALNQNLFEWPFPSLLPLVIFWMPFIFHKSYKEYLLLGGLIAAPTIYFFYFFQDLCLGPRFYYSSVPFILILTAKAIFQIMKGIAYVRNYAAARVINAFTALLFLSLLFAGLVRMPQLYRFYSDSFWKVDNRMIKKVHELGIGNALIFQKSYDKDLKNSDLGSGFLHNSPWLNSPVVFARDLGERNAELAVLFPGRHYYLASRDSKGAVIIEPLDFIAKTLRKK